MSKLNRILWTGLVLVGAACGDDVTVTPPPEPPTPGVRSVSVGPDGGSVQVGGTLQMTAAVTTDPGAGAATITWSSSDNAKATVNATGLVTGVAVGSVGIRATATVGTSSAQGVATVNVVAAPACVVSGVAVTPSGNASIVVGQTLQATAVVNGGPAACAQTVTWNSLAPGIATVSATGLITGVTGGIAVITATSTADPTKSAALSVQVLVPTPATVEIQSVTQGGLGTPINLSNVAGQIEITLNVDRGDKTLERVDALIGGQVVASQVFTVQPVANASSPEAASAPVVVVLNVNTRQLAKIGNLFLPVVFNGQSGITANLYVVGSATPIGSNLVPVLMNNPDAATVPSDLEDVSTAAPEPVIVGGNSWYKGSMSTDINYIAFTKQTPAASPSVLNAACGAQSSAFVGTPTTGLLLTNTWTCAGVEGAFQVTGPGNTTWPAGTVGIDGSTLLGPEDGNAAVIPAPGILPGYSTVGAQFCVNPTVPCPAASQRWNLITPSPSGVPGPLFYVDNAAPAVNVADDGSAVVPGFVAFNDAFDQYWVNDSYSFNLWDGLANGGDWLVTDGGVGVDFGNSGVRQADFATGACTGQVLTDASPLASTVASDGTPDGHRICAFGADLLGNAAVSGPSNWFGKDDVAPQARIAGSTGALPGIAPATVPAVSANANTTIFSIAAPFVATDAWGIEGLDDAAGFDQNNLVPGFPANESMTLLNPANNPATAGFPCGFTSPLPVVLSDNYVRVNHLPGAAVLDCGTGAPGYFWVSMSVIDRAGNESTVITRNYAIDQYAVPVLASVGPAAIFYTVGQPANFFLFGSDDLEIIEADLILTYPGMSNGDGLVSLTKALSAIAGAARWDQNLTNILAGAAAIDPYLIGRIDRTCTGAGTPYAGCLVADGPTVSVDYNNNDTDLDAVFEDDDKNPIQVGAVAYDVASQPSAPVVAGLLGAQTNDIAEQWSTNVSSAAMVTWRVLTPTGATVVAEWVTTSSLVPPYFDSVLLGRINGTTLTVCGTYPSPVRTDNGITRQYTYTITKPATGPCAAGGNWYAIGLKNGAALATQGQP